MKVLICAFCPREDTFYVEEDPAEEEAYWEALDKWDHVYCGYYTEWGCPDCVNE